ncbi:urotensin-2-like [Gouania willdenowi]|uniref:Urotensin-2-like n=1 Tax=Gouania willdenowi TaxID=441366 RepID=A0A8C5FYX4_GOUWI|nr:urotensin-2-like [Gouania willdenowi]
MKWNQFVSGAFLLVAAGPLLAHQIPESAEMSYQGPVSMEELGMGPLDDLSLSEKTFPPQEAAGLRYPTLISGEINRDGVRTTGLLPLGIKRDVLLEKSNLLNPFNRVLAVRKQFRKRGGNSECFWKYCV